MGGPVDIPITIRLEGGDSPVRARTRMVGLGAYVLVLDTVLPDKGIEMHSTYTGHPRVSTLASHLMLAPGLHETLAVEHDHGALSVIEDRRHCLYDHLQRLQDLLAELGFSAQIPLDEIAFDAVER